MDAGKTTDYGMVKTMKKEDAEASGLYQVIGGEIDDRYIEELKKLAIHPEMLRQEARDLKIVYTPLHGTGNLPVRRVLKELGFENVYVVKEQEMPDGGFPTVSYPNPEDKDVFALALQLAKEVDADIVLATDPDADRLGMYAKDARTGEYTAFTGNMSGMLILEYQLAQRRAYGTLPKNGAVVTTIVSGKMARNIAREYQVELVETLTGFKYIGEQIKLFEQDKSHEFLFGYEESCGCLVGTHARDKDAVVAAMALCEVAAFCKSQGMTLCDRMRKLYWTYGYFKETLCTVTLKGQDGARRITEAMERIRQAVPKEIGGISVSRFLDYREDVQINMADGRKSKTGLPKSDVLYFQLKHEAWCCIRPSGTEPKIKLYVGVRGINEEDADSRLKVLAAAVESLVK